MINIVIKMIGPDEEVGEMMKIAFEMMIRHLFCDVVFVEDLLGDDGAEPDIFITNNFKEAHAAARYSTKTAIIVTPLVIMADIEQLKRVAKQFPQRITFAQWDCGFEKGFATVLEKIIKEKSKAKDVEFVTKH